MVHLGVAQGKLVPMAPHKHVLRGDHDAAWLRHVYLEEQWTSRDICATLGISKQNLWYLRQREGIPTRAEPYAYQRRHGGPARYQDGCRCDLCVTGYGAYRQRFERKVRYRHGIPVAELADLKALSVCDACGSTDPGHTTNGWCVDHDHAHCPGQQGCAECFRGILCSGCNTALGLTHDDPVRLRALADYLDAWAGREPTAESDI